MSAHNGVSAFPQGLLQEGMTLRDYFAAKAMQAMWSNSHMSAPITEAAAKKGLPRAQAVAEAAYEIADSMIAERAK